VKGKGARAKGKFCCANKLEAQVSLGKRKEVDEDVEAMCNKQKYSEHVPVPPFLLLRIRPDDSPSDFLMSRG